MYVYKCDYKYKFILKKKGIQYEDDGNVNFKHLMMSTNNSFSCEQ